MEGQKVSIAMSNDRSRNDPEPMDRDDITAQAAKLSQEMSEIKDLLKVLVNGDRFQVEPQHAPPYRHARSYQHPLESQNSSTGGRYPAHNRRIQSHYGPVLDQSPVQPAQKYRWAPDKKKTVCAYCGFIGHIQTVCRKKAAANQINPPPGPRGPQQGQARQPKNRQQQGNY